MLNINIQILQVVMCVVFTEVSTFILPITTSYVYAYSVSGDSRQFLLTGR